MNKRLTAYSDSLLILSAPASLPFTKQRQNVIPASKNAQTGRMGLMCNKQNLCLTDIQKKKG